jgi:phosphoribosylformylglycinamidine cyclo-ligase
MADQTKYADSGVNNELKEEVSEILYNAAKQTWDNRKGKLGELVVPFDDFSGVRAIDVSNLPAGTLMNMGFDGVGTKIELAERAGDFRTIAYDLFAMVCDDAVVRGAEPVLIGSILDTNSLKGPDGKPFLEQVKQLAEGYIGAAKAANVAVVNGETAELGRRVGGYGTFNSNWAAAITWFAKKDRLFTGREIKPGDTLVGLEERGFRSNGISLVRKIFENNFGPEWHNQKPAGFGYKTLAEAALVHSRIYSAAVVDMFGGYCGEPKTEIHGVAHITGGGLPGKLGRVLKPSGLGALIDSPFMPSDLVHFVQKLGNVSDEEAYKTWNMGQGMVIITPKPYEVIKIAKEHKISAGFIGKVSKTPGIMIASRGYEAFNEIKPKDLAF